MRRRPLLVSLGPLFLGPERWSAEADGNRTRQGAFAPSPVLKTGGPTRRPDASAE
jgi:hypothetical protein